MRPARSNGQGRLIFDELERIRPFLFTLLENTPDSVCILAPDLTLRFVNRLLPGLTLPDVIGRSVYDYLAPESRAIARASFERVLATGEPGHFEVVGHAAHGKIAVYQSRVSPVMQGGEIIALMLIATDITERTELKQGLREKRDLLDLARDATGLGLWTWDLRHDEIDWDEIMKRIHGVQEGPRNFAELLELIDPDDRPRIRARAAQTMTQDQDAITDLEYRTHLPNGQVAWLLSRGKVIRDPNGEPIKLIGGVIDITAKKRATEALRKSEERSRVLVDVLAEGVLALAADDGYTTCNASAERLLGLTRDQLLGRTPTHPDWRCIHEDGSPFPSEAFPLMTTLRTGEPRSGVILGVHKPGGELTWLSINSRPLFEAGSTTPSSVVCSFFDITAIKRSEAERERLLREEQAARRRAVLLAEASKLLASSLDIRASLVDIVEHAVPELCDLAAFELVDTDGAFGPSHAVFVAAEDPELAAGYRELRLRDVESDPLVDIIRRGEPSVSTIGPGTCPMLLPGVPPDHPLADRMRYCACVHVPLVARDVPLGVLVLAARTRTFGPDDQALAEELGLRAAQALDNARLYSEMELALAKREEFIVVAAHELRTPLTPIMLQGEHLWQMAAGEREGEFSRETVARRLRIILRQTERLHRLIEELLDVSQITGGRLRIEVEDVDFSALLRDTVEHFAEPLARAGCEVRLTLPARAPGRTDRTRFEQIVSNLLANAMKYGAGQPIEVTLDVEPDTVYVSVCDHGIGISHEDQARIFHRFERAVSERHYGGLGLGLWVTRHVAEAMGGDVSVSSTPGSGSIFRVHLPRAGPPPA